MALLQVVEAVERTVAASGVFQAAQEAASQYLENIQRISGQQDALCRALKETAEKETAQIRREAQAYRRNVHAEADACWKQVADKTAGPLEYQEALREMIRPVGEVKNGEE